MVGRRGLRTAPLAFENILVEKISKVTFFKGLSNIPVFFVCTSCCTGIYSVLLIIIKFCIHLLTINYEFLLFRDIDNETTFITNVEIQDVLDGKYHLIYAHPETLLGSKAVGKMLRSKLYKELVCCTVVDEVHMISEW